VSLLGTKQSKKNL